MPALNDSIRKKITDALVTQLALMNTGGGYNLDWATGDGGGGAEKYRNVNTFNTLPKLIVGYSEEQKRDESTFRIQNDLDVDIFGVIEWSQADTNQFEDDLDAAVYDVELLLLTQSLLDPPLGVTGLERIIIKGHDKLGPTELNQMAFLLSVTMQYSHKVSDPGEYT